MEKRMSIPLQDYKFPGQFPDLCIYCGKPKDSTAMYLGIFNEKKDNETVEHRIEIQFPYCKEHAKAVKRNKFLFYLDTIFRLVLGAAAAVWMWTGGATDEMFGYKEGEMLMLLKTVASVGGGYIVYKLTEFLILLIRQYIGPIISRSPFDRVLGFKFYTLTDKKAFLFDFENEEFAKRFNEINKEYVIWENVE